MIFYFQPITTRWISLEQWIIHMKRILSIFTEDHSQSGWNEINRNKIIFLLYIDSSRQLSDIKIPSSIQWHSILKFF